MNHIGEDGNYVLTTDKVAREALRLLKNNLVARKVVTKGFEKEFAGKEIGDKINIKLPYRLQSETGAALTNTSALVDKSVTFSIDNQEHVVVEAISKTRTMALKDYSSRYLKSAVAQLANKVDLSVMDALNAGTNASYYSTFGTGITLADFLKAKAHQGLLAVPDGRVAFINLLDEADISQDVMSLYSSKNVDTAFQKGYAGQVGDYKLYSSQNISNYSPTGSDDCLVAGTVSEGATTIPIDDGTGGSGTDNLAAGDVIQFAGVNWVNPVSRVDTGIPATFVVQSATASSVTLNVPLYSHTEDYANVYSLPADNAAITVLGTKGTQTRQNFLFHPNAVALAVIPMFKPANKNASVMTDPDSGLSIRVVEDYSYTTDKAGTRLDVLWGTKVIYPELTMRLFGANI